MFMWVHVQGILCFLCMKQLPCIALDDLAFLFRFTFFQEAVGNYFLSLSVLLFPPLPSFLQLLIPPEWQLHLCITHVEPSWILKAKQLKGCVEMFK